MTLSINELRSEASARANPPKNTISRQLSRWLQRPRLFIEQGGEHSEIRTLRCAGFARYLTGKGGIMIARTKNLRPSHC